MAAKIVLKYSNPTLRKVSENVQEINPEILDIINDMLDTMEFYDGLGLSAPQIGISLRIAVLHKKLFVFDSSSHVILINPQLNIDDGVEMQFQDEGCLSLPGIYSPVKRPKQIAVTTLKTDGTEFKFTAKGFLAAAVQHECDHLDGTLFIDRVTKAKKDILLRRYKKAKRKTKK